jgi:hypothetical protein
MQLYFVALHIKYACRPVAQHTLCLRSAFRLGMFHLATVLRMVTEPTGSGVCTEVCFTGNRWWR